MSQFEPPREVHELYLAPEETAKAVGCTRRVKKLANVICLSLATPVPVAALTSFVVMGLYYLINIFVLHHTSVNLHTLTDTASVQGELLSCLTYLSYMFIPFMLMVLVLKQNPFKIVPVKRIKDQSLILPGVAIALTVSFIAGILTNYIQFILGFVHLQATSPDFTAPKSIPALLIYFIQICILAPLCEEFIFRGVILHNLKQFGNAFAVVVSAILFSMLHGDLLQMPLALLVGLVFGVMVIKSGSIWLTVIMHAAVNTVSVAVDWISTSYGNSTANNLYFSISLIAIIASIAIFFSLHEKQSFKSRISDFKKSVLPNRFLIMKFALTPGFLIFSGVTVILLVMYMEVI
jgi:hypothetical protein